MEPKREIETIEARLMDLISASRSRWMQESILLQEVQDQRLYEPEHKSFSQWIKSLAQKASVHESIIWEHLKAGRFYAQYEARARAKGVEVPPAEEVSIPSESLSLIEKIAGSNPDVADDLIGKVAEQKLTRKDLQAGYKATKALREKNGQRAAATSRHDEPLETLSDDSVTAVQLVMALSSGGNAWLSSLVPTDRSKHIRNKYATFPEFSVRPGTSSHARRIDVVVAETATCSAVDEIHIHGIENKVSKADLKGDDKVGEYAAFVDFLWLCVPTELVEAARDIVLPEWGILEYTSDGSLQIAKHPSKLTAPMREDTLVELALRTL